MAIQDAKKFLDAVDNDPDLQEKLKGSLDHVLNTAHQHGYTVSKKDLADELKRRWGMTNPPDYGEDPDTCMV